MVSEICYFFVVCCVFYFSQVTNDIFTREDAEFLTKNAALEEGRRVVYCLYVTECICARQTAAPLVCYLFYYVATCCAFMLVDKEPEGSLVTIGPQHDKTENNPKRNQNLRTHSSKNTYFEVVQTVVFPPRWHAHVFPFIQEADIYGCFAHHQHQAISLAYPLRLFTCTPCYTCDRMTSCDNRSFG